MATLVLTVVGTALGGPVGGALGAALGQAVDGRLFGKSVSGSRLADLRLQTSRYGDRIPRLYGTMRVAGTVIWATDLKERRHKQGGGKGQSSVTTYSYSASFAVALSSRPVVGVRRIWADGNLLRGAAGDFKTGLGAFRLHRGDEDQAVDALIAADKGGAATPGHRGIAYAVFEDLQLADYGNRIPSMTFELVADSDAPGIDAIAADLSDGLIAPGQEGAGFVPGGYAATGGSVSEALSPLVEGLGLAVCATKAGLALRGVAEAGVDAVLERDALAGVVNGKKAEARVDARSRAEDVPVRLNAGYYDPARDYQAGVQTAERPGVGRVEVSLDLPALLTANTARGLAEQRLRALWAARTTLDVRCDWRALTLEPGALVTVAGEGGRWRIERCEWEAMAVRLRLARVAGGAAPAVEAAGGESVSQIDRPHGATSLIVADLPAFGDEAATAPLVVCAAAGGGEGWRAAELFAEDGATGALTSLGGTAPPAVMGQVGVLPAAKAGAALMDRRSAVEVTLLNDGMTLTGVEDADLLQGSNPALLGREVIQFGGAERIGERRWRLTRLLRGRRGTEWAMGLHEEGERFLLLDAVTLVDVPSSHLAVGTSVRIDAIGIGDAAPVEAEEWVTGQAMLPLSPAHVRVRAVDASGSAWRMDWIRRSRVGWRWRDFIDAPLGEEQERYAVSLSHAGAVFRAVETSGAGWLYDAEAVRADRAAGIGGEVAVTIRQIGTYGAGQPATGRFVL